MPGSGVGGGAAATAAALAFDVLQALGGEAGPGTFGGRQRPGHVGRDVQVGVEQLGRVVRLRRLRIVQPERLVDQPPTGHVLPVHERDRDPGGAGPTGAPDAVHVRVRVLGAVVVDHVRDAGDVEPAGCHVGRDQDVDLSDPERPERAFPGALAQIAVHGRDREPAEVQVLGHPVGGALRAREDHGEPALARLQDARHHLDLVQGVGAVRHLPGQRRRAGGVVVVGVHGDRLAQEPPGQRHDRVRHRGREQHGLPFGRQHRQDLLDVVEEPEVEHPVGFVEHERAHPVQP